MIRTLFVLAGVVGAMTLSSSAASGQPPKDLGKKASIEFKESTVVGNATIASGHYAVKHQIVDGQHYLVFRSQTIESARGGFQHWTKTMKEEAARVRCRLAPIGRSRENLVVTRPGVDGTRQLVEIRFRNALWGHIVMDSVDPPANRPRRPTDRLMQPERPGDVNPSRAARIAGRRR